MGMSPYEIAVKKAKAEKAKKEEASKKDPRMEEIEIRLEEIRKKDIAKDNSPKFYQEKHNEQLVSCESCNNSISKRSVKCPNCGNPVLEFCVVCKNKIPKNSIECPKCGDPAPFDQQSTEKNTGIINISKGVSISVPSSNRENYDNKQCVHREISTQKLAGYKSNYSNQDIEFTGTALGLFGRGLLTILLSCLVIPAPWMLSWFCCWFVQNIRKAGKSTLSFSGRGSQIWFPVVASYILPQAGLIFSILPLDPIYNYLLYIFLCLSLNCYFYLIIAKWFLRNIVSSTGTKVFFVGEYLSYLGWSLLFLMSFVSIVGWAWVNGGIVRWFCRNVISSNNHIVQFHGNGWNILWRTVIYLFSCILIIPIPWTSLWLIKWYFRNITIERH